MRKRIIEATKRVIIKKGFQKIKISEIAKEAKIGKGTVYLYFKDKQQLLISMISDFFNEAEAFLKQSKEFKGNGLEKLKKFIELDLDFYERNKELFGALGKEIESFSKVFDIKKRELIHKRYFKFIESLSSTIQICKQKGIIRNIDSKEVSLILISIIHAYAGRRIHGFSRQPLMKEKSKILRVFLNGVGK